MPAGAEPAIGSQVHDPDNFICHLECSAPEGPYQSAASLQPCAQGWSASNQGEDASDLQGKISVAGWPWFLSDTHVLITGKHPSTLNFLGQTAEEIIVWVLQPDFPASPKLQGRRNWCEVEQHKTVQTWRPHWPGSKESARRQVKVGTLCLFCSSVSCGGGRKR